MFVHRLPILMRLVILKNTHVPGANMENELFGTRDVEQITWEMLEKKSLDLLFKQTPSILLRRVERKDSTSLNLS